MEDHAVGPVAVLDSLPVDGVELLAEGGGGRRLLCDLCDLCVSFLRVQRGPEQLCKSSGRAAGVGRGARGLREGRLNRLAGPVAVRRLAEVPPKNGLPSAVGKTDIGQPPWPVISCTPVM